MPECNPSFVKDLKGLDRRLGVKFNGEHFVVTYDRGYGEPVNIHRIKEDDGGYRQPDRRDLVVIGQGDLSRGDKMEVRLKKLAYASEQIRAEARRKSNENIRDMTKDGKNQLQRAFLQATNLGKGNSTFRRVDLKHGKNVVRTVK